MEKFQKDELVTLRNVLVAMGVQEDDVDGMINEKLGGTNNWDKIELDGNGRVTHLGLDSAGLSGTIPSELSHLSNLKYLYLSNNQLSGPIPSELSHLSNLEYLYLGGNQLSGPIPSELSHLSNLKYLHLGGNQLSGPIPSELSHLSNLKYLYLNDNQLSGPIPSELSHLSNLIWLNLGGNQLSAIPSELSHLSNLKYLNLGGNQLSGPIPSELSRLSNLTRLYLRDNTNLEGVVPVMPSGCTVDVSGTSVSSVAVKTKPLKTIMDYIMTVLYVVLGYADLVTDIIVIAQLISIGEDGLAAANIFFIVLGMFLGYWNSKRTLLDLFLNVSQLSILVNGYLTLAQGKQTEGLVLSKKMDAIVRSMPSIILQLYTVLKDLGEYPKGSYAFNTFVVSIALGVLGASVTLSGLHQKAGNRLFSWQFAVVNLYYFSEILLRSMLAAIAFLSVGAYAFIAVGIDVLSRGFITLVSNNEINFSLTCLYLGSDNALNDEDAWVFGSFLTFLYSLIFIIVMWTLPTDDLHELRDRGTATQLSSIMLCAFVAKTCLYYFIEKNMEAPSEDGDTKATTKETVNELHNNV